MNKRVDPSSISRAAALILAGELVAIPTETVYGLAADATNDAAVAGIFAAKGRPAFNPLIVHVADAEMAKRYVAFPPLAEKLAAAFWPGPLTLVLPRRDAVGEISHLVSAGLETLAVRAPASEIAQALIAATGRPLAAPSANRSGAISPTTAEHVRESLGGRVAMILAGGPSRIGVESTIVKIDGGRAILLRPGGIPRADIERVVGAPLAAASGGVEAPGMLERHYAPQVPLRLGVLVAQADEAFLGFGKVAGAGPFAVNLSEGADLAEAATGLFARLRAAEALCSVHGLKGIAVAPVPDEGLGEAINDRLRRAAAAWRR